MRQGLAREGVCGICSNILISSWVSSSAGAFIPERKTMVYPTNKPTTIKASMAFHMLPVAANTRNATYTDNRGTPTFRMYEMISIESVM